MSARYQTILFFLAFVAAGLSANGAHGQAATDWLVTTGSSGADEGKDLATDGSGSVYVTGTFDEELDLNGDGTPDVTTTLQDGAVVLAKLSSDGSFNWARVATVNTLVPEDPFIATDEAGNSFLAATFSGAADLDGDGTDDVSGGGSEDGVLGAYDPTGALRWARRIGGSDADGVDGVAVGGTGEAYVSGFIRGEADFDDDGEPDADGGTLGEMFVARYTASGTFEWVTTADAGTNPQVGGVATDGNGRVYVTGMVDGAGDFDGDGDDEIGGAGQGDVFVAAYDDTGDLRWASGAGGGGFDGGIDVATGDDGGVFVTGSFEETADFDGDGEPDVSSTGDEDVFLAQYDASGAFQWVASGGGGEFGTDRGVAVDVASGNVVVAGRVESGFTQPIDFDGDGNTDLTPKGNADILVARYDTGGTLRGAVAPGGGASENGTGVAATPNGGAVVTGFYRGSADFDLDGSDEATGAGGSDDNLVVVRYAPTALPAQPAPEQIDRVRLHGNTPNPVSGEMTIRYELPEPAGVTLAVYDVLGRKVATLVDGRQAAGSKRARLQAHDLSSGVYVIRLTAQGRARTQAFTVVQ